MSQIQNCGTCQHWGEKTDNSRRVCMRIIHEDVTPNDDIACVSDFEGYNATLETSANFGCVLHEPRKEQA